MKRLAAVGASVIAMACAHRQNPGGPREEARAEAREAEAESIRDATTDGVSACAFVAVLHGKGAWPGALGVQKAMANVREQAVDRGATHLVWKYTAPGLPGVAEAEAFRCGGTAKK